MANINITELQANENVGLSINTINSNFNLLASGINTLEGFLNTDSAHGLLTIGEINIPSYTGDTSGVTFSVGNGANIAGVLTIGDVLTSNGAAIFNGDTSFVQDVTFDKVNGETAALLLKQTLKIQSEFVLSAASTVAADDSGSAAVKRVQSTTTAGQYGVNVLTVIGNATSTNDTVIIGAGIEGQILHVKFDGTGATNVIKLQHDNFDSAYTTGVTITGTAATDLEKEVVTLYCTASGWSVLSVLDTTNVTVSF